MVILIISLFETHAQTYDSFQAYLSSFDISCHLPKGKGVKVLRKDSTNFLKHQFGLSLKKEKVEIRFEFVEEPKEHDYYIPNFQNARRLVNYARNSDESVMSMFYLGTKELAFSNADWGSQGFFVPKMEFSEANHCQMISLYKEGIGHMFIYMLFNDPNNPYLENSLNFFSYK